jgi:hypothetical protein
MKSRIPRREMIVHGLIYIWLSWIDLQLKLYTTPAWFICIHIYLRRWFDIRISFCGVLILAAIIPLTFRIGDLQESSPLLLLTFLLGLWTKREDRKILMTVVFLIGGINNETMLILPLVYRLYNFVALDVRRIAILCRDTFLISLPMGIAVGTIRYINRDRPVRGGSWQLPNNLEGLLNGSVLHWGFLSCSVSCGLTHCCNTRASPCF